MQQKHFSWEQWLPGQPGCVLYISKVLYNRLKLEKLPSKKSSLSTVASCLITAIETHALVMAQGLTPNAQKQVKSDVHHGIWRVEILSVLDCHWQNLRIQKAKHYKNACVSPLTGSVQHKMGKWLYRLWCIVLNSDLCHPAHSNQPGFTFKP